MGKINLIDDVRRGMENKIIEFRTLLMRDMDSLIEKSNEREKKRIASSFSPLIGELHNLAERLTDRVVDCRGL